MSSYLEQTKGGEKNHIGSGICRNKTQTTYKVKTLKFQHTGAISYPKSHSFSPDPDNNQQYQYYMDNPYL